MGVDYFENLSSINFVLQSGDNSNLNFGIYEETYYQYIFDPDSLSKICLFHNQDARLSGFDMFDKQTNLKRCGLGGGCELLVELAEDERIVGFASQSTANAIHFDF